VLKTRIITALILAPLLAAAVFLVPTVALAGLLAGFVALGAWEWAVLSGLERPAARLFYAASLTAALALAWELEGQAGRLLLLLGGAWWCIVLAWLLLYESGRLAAPAGWLKLFAGYWVLAPAWAALIALHGVPGRGPWLVMAVMALVWAADIGAYFSGRRFGRHKLAPRLSPGKSWEGVAGGLALAAVAGAAFAVTDDRPPGVTAIIALAALAIAAISVLGDLFESMMKRLAGMKDSGRLFPGHGGVLDRIDSLTAAAPAAALFWFWLEGRP